MEALAHIRVACCEPSPNLGPDRHHRCSIMRITHIGTFWSTITRTPFTGTLSIRRQALPVRSPHTPQQLGQNPSALDVLAGPPKRRPGSARSVAKSPTRLRDPLLLSATSRYLSSRRGLQCSIHLSCGGLFAVGAESVERLERPRSKAIGPYRPNPPPPSLYTYICAVASRQFSRDRSESQPIA